MATCNQVFVRDIDNELSTVSKIVTGRFLNHFKGASNIVCICVLNVFMILSAKINSLAETLYMEAAI